MMTFTLGTLRADYLCHPALWNKDKGARQGVEYWLLGGPMPMDNQLAGYMSVMLAMVVRQGAPPHECAHAGV